VGNKPQVGEDRIGPTPGKLLRLLLLVGSSRTLHKNNLIHPFCSPLILNIFTVVFKGKSLQIKILFGIKHKIMRAYISEG
jgi:hypothetical protein